MLQAQGLLEYADTSAVMHRLTLSVHDQTFINNSISKALSLLPVMYTPAICTRLWQHRCTVKSSCWCIPHKCAQATLCDTIKSEKVTITTVL